MSKTTGASGNGSTNSVPLLQRDLEGARSAYKTGDASASALAHSTKALPSAEHNAEPHVEGGEFIKSIVFGGLDGILTSFAIVAGAAGAGLSVKAVLAIGISNVLADALAMGVGEYLSSKSEREYVREEHARETWEFENYPTGEISESARARVAARASTHARCAPASPWRDSCSRAHAARARALQWWRSSPTGACRPRTRAR